MSSDKPNQTEFAVGIILVCVAALLLYTEYNIGYWGVLALGIVFIIKFLVSARSSGRTEKAIEKRGPSDRISNDRLNH